MRKIDEEVVPQAYLREHLGAGPEKLTAISIIRTKDASSLEERFDRHQLNETQRDILRKIISEKLTGVLPAVRDHAISTIEYKKEHVFSYKKLCSLGLSGGFVSNLSKNRSQSWIDDHDKLWDAVGVALQALEDCKAEVVRLQGLVPPESLGAQKIIPDDGPHYWPEKAAEHHISETVDSGSGSACLTLQDVADLWNTPEFVVRYYLERKTIRRWKFGFDRDEMVKVGIELGGFYCSVEGFFDDNGNLREEDEIGIEVNGNYFRFENATERHDFYAQFNGIKPYYLEGRFLTDKIYVFMLIVSAQNNVTLSPH